MGMPFINFYYLINFFYSNNDWATPINKLLEKALNKGIGNRNFLTERKGVMS